MGHDKTKTSDCYAILDKDDQQGQIIITVVVEGATCQHLRSECPLAFHS